MNQLFSGVEITSIAGCVPSNRVTNDFFQNLLSPKELRIFEKTVGILERRWVSNDTTASDLGYIAANDLLQNPEIDKQDIECLIFLSQTPDYKIPFTSNILQNRLHLKREILCLDINAGCAGFIQGLSTAFAIAKTLKPGKKVLLIVAETLSKILSKNDRSTSMLFGDGASALLIEHTENLEAKAFFNFFSDGANYDAIIIPDGGFRNEPQIGSFEMKIDEAGNTKNRLHLEMDGPKVFDFTLREIAPGIKKLLDCFELDINTIEHFILHQSNQFILKQIAAQLGIGDDKLLINIQNFGNTSGVSIPLAIVTENVRLLTSKNLLLSGYGVGLNWGNALIQNHNFSVNNLIEFNES